MKSVLLFLLLFVSWFMQAQVSNERLFATYNVNYLNAVDAYLTDSVVYTYPNNWVLAGTEQKFSWNSLGVTKFSYNTLYKPMGYRGLLPQIRYRIIQDTLMNQIIFRQEVMNNVLNKWVKASDSVYNLNANKQVILKEKITYDLLENKTSAYLTKSTYNNTGQIMADSFFNNFDTLSGKLLKTISFQYHSNETVQVENVFNSTGSITDQYITKWDTLGRKIWYEYKIKTDTPGVMMFLYSDEYIYQDTMQRMIQNHVAKDAALNFSKREQTTWNAAHTIETILYEDGFGGFWNPTQQKMSEYQNQKLIQQKIFNYKPATADFSLVTKRDYQYDAFGNLQEYTQSGYASDTLKNQSKNVYTYNHYQHITREENSTLNLTTQSFELKHQTNYLWEKIGLVNNTDSQAVSIAPNPSQHVLFFTFYHEQVGTAHITFYNQNGQIAATYAAPIVKGNNTIKYNHELSSGLYYVKLFTREVQHEALIVVY